MIEQETKSEYYPNLKYDSAYFGKARGLVSNGVKRFILDGTLAVAALDSVKFGKEVHLQIFTKDLFVTEDSSGSDYRRVEMYFDFDDLDKLIATLEEIKERGTKSGNSQSN